MAPPPAPTSANTEVSQVAVSNEIDNSAWSALVKSGPPAYRILDDAAEKIAVADGLERRRDPVSGKSSYSTFFPCCSAGCWSCCFPTRLAGTGGKHTLTHCPCLPLLCMPYAGHNSLHASKAFAPGDIVHKIGAEASWAHSVAPCSWQ